MFTLTHKQPTAQRYLHSTVATDSLELKKQVTNSYCADQMFIVLDQSYTQNAICTKQRQQKTLWNNDSTV